MKKYHIKHAPADTIKINRLVTIYYNEFSDNFCFEGEKHNFWEMVYVDKGTAFATAGENDHTLPQGTIIFHKPNEFHTIRAAKNDPPNVVVLSFTTKSSAMSYFEGRITTLPKNLKFHMAEILENAKNTFLLPMPRGYLELKESPIVGGEQMVKTHLEQLLIELIRKSSESTFSKYREIDENTTIGKCIDYLNANIYGNVTINDVCEKTNYSKTYICTLFREVTGKTIINYYRELKIEEAKILIRKNKYTFAEISEMLGFSTPTYFTHIFSKTAKMTPSQYKRSVK